DRPIPGWPYTFGTLIDAQAQGDFQALEAHELPVLRVHLGADPDAGLKVLHDLPRVALQEEERASCTLASSGWCGWARTWSTAAQRRPPGLKAKGFNYIDAGVSGGIWGLANGFCLMVGGEPEPVGRLEPVFRSLAPEGGYLHVGGPGAGHYVKMVHNGIEYGMMQAYAEGFEIMHASSYELDLAGISELWMQGSVVRSWLLELAGRAFRANGPDLEHLKGFVADSGEGRWTVQEAIDHDVPAPALTLSLLTRFRSRQDDSYGAKVLAALRNEFGGHEVKTE